MHVDAAVARPGEAVAEAQVGARRAADGVGEFDDPLRRQPGDGGGPLRRAAGEMRLELARAVGVLLQIGPVGEAIAKQHVHDGAGQRPVGAGADDEPDVGLLDGGGLIDVDHGQPGAALLAGPGDVGHDVDLGVDRVGAPDDHEVGFRHLARVGAHQLAGAGDEARPGGGDADGVVHVGIALGMAQPVQPVAHDEPHGAGVVVRPHGFRPMARFRLEQVPGDLVQRVVPRQALPLARALGPLALQRVEQAVGVVQALGIARHLLADDAGGVAVVGAAHPADGAGVEQFHVERAGRRAVVRADGVADADVGAKVHGTDITMPRKPGR
jgi:hypothetical protein